MQRFPSVVRWEGGREAGERERKHIITISRKINVASRSLAALRHPAPHHNSARRFANGAEDQTTLLLILLSCASLFAKFIS